MSLIGLDVGTTGCKTIFFSHDGKILSSAFREYPITTPKPDWVEQDAEMVWQLVWETLREASGQVNQDPPKALALSVQGEAIIPVDRSGMAMRPAILGMDTRTVEENRWLADHYGAQALFSKTGMPLHTINTLPKLIWLKNNEPQIFNNAHRFLLYEDFILQKLGADAVISHCLASRTQLYDLSRGCWAEDILALSGIDEEKLARLSPVEGGTIGKMDSQLVSDLGFLNEILLVSGGHDQACAALGSGVIRDGIAMVSTGTAEVVEVAMAAPNLNDKLRRGNISIYRHVKPGLYLAMTLNHSGGLLLRWFRDQFCKIEIAQAGEQQKDAYDLILGKAPSGPTDLLVLPHFSGSGTPFLDITSKGAILGLSFATTQASVAKALMEGLTFELKINLELLQEAGIVIDTLHAVGGGAKSSMWLQMKADICTKPVWVPEVTEAACLGAAILAGIGAHVYPDFDDAIEQMVKMKESIKPNEDAGFIYGKRFGVYCKVYPAIIDIQRKLK